MEESGVTGRAKGGKKRAEILSAEERKAIASKGAEARWGSKPLRATHKGNFKEHFGVDVECYVLNDAHKTAVISQSGMGRALGLSPRGNAFPRFLASKGMAETLSAQTLEKIQQPLKFQWSSGGAQPPSDVNGFDVTLLVDVCKAVDQAESEGRLNWQQARVARQARIILAASAKAGIQGLAWALAGYSPTAQEVIEAFKLYVQEEAKKYEPEFPNELYLEWHRLYNLAVPERGKPWQFKFLTVNHVYYPLAQSSGKLLTLLRALKAQGGARSKKLFQFLNDIGARALRMQLGRILEMAQSSGDRETYEGKITARFGGQQRLEFPVPIPSTERQRTSGQ